VRALRLIYLDGAVHVSDEQEGGKESDGTREDAECYGHEGRVTEVEDGGREPNNIQLKREGQKYRTINIISVITIKTRFR